MRPNKCLKRNPKRFRSSSGRHRATRYRIPRRRRLARRRRALDDTAAEHARLAGLGIIEHAGLTRRYPILTGDQLNLDAADAMSQPSRLRGSGRANLDEYLAIRE